MKYRISVIGAGNGGQAIAGYCAASGCEVCLYNRELESVAPVVQTRCIELTGALEMRAEVAVVTDDMRTAVEFADIIMVVTTATAHRDVAGQMLPWLRDGQTIILNPGRTCGVLEMVNVFSERPALKVHLGEAQTLVFACRVTIPGRVNVIGVKEKVMLSGRNSAETKCLVESLNPIFPCFIGAENLIRTGLENIGAIFHPAVVLFNAATIERNTPFYFYRDMTPNVAAFIQKLDDERLAVGRAYGVELMSVTDWITYAYPNTWGDTLCERMQNNPAYYDILAPGSIFTRQLTEDIPTGIIPMAELGAVAGVATPLMNSIIEMSSALLGIDFRKNGRTLERLGLNSMGKEEIMDSLS